MKRLQIFPKNREFYLRLISFGEQVLEACRSEGVEPIVYGSIAYLHATGDSEIEISDIDFLTSESNFDKITRLFANVDGVRVEPTTYNSLKLLKGDLKVSFDSNEHYFDGIHALPREVSIFATRFKLVDAGALTEVYLRGARSIPLKRTAYERKLAQLRALAQK